MYWYSNLYWYSTLFWVVLVLPYWKSPRNFLYWDSGTGTAKKLVLVLVLVLRKKKGFGHLCQRWPCTGSTYTGTPFFVLAVPIWYSKYRYSQYEKRSTGTPVLEVPKPRTGFPFFSIRVPVQICPLNFQTFKKTVKLSKNR